MKNLSKEINKIKKNRTVPNFLNRPQFFTQSEYQGERHENKIYKGYTVKSNVERHL